MRSIFLIVLCSICGAAAAAPACTLNRIASSDMLISDNGLVIGALVDAAKMPFVLDTRLPRSVLFEQTVAKLGLPLSPSANGYVDIDSHPLFEWTKVPDVQIGGLHYSTTPFLVARKPVGGGADAVAGELGADFLRYYDVEIDPAAGKLNIYSQDHCEGKVVYWAKEYFVSTMHMRGNVQVEIDVELDGQPLHAVLSTGLADSLLEFRAAAKRFGLDEHSVGMQPAGSVTDLSNYPIPTYRYDFKKLKFGEFTINNPQIKVAPIGTQPIVHTHLDPDYTADLLIGMNFLRKLHLYIAYREDKLYYTVGQ